MKEMKLSILETIGLVIILLILLFFPYFMVKEHLMDNMADSYYHK